MNQDNSNPDLEAEQEKRAIAFIRSVTKAATGQELSEEQAGQLYLKAKDRMLDAMAQADVEETTP